MRHPYYPAAFAFLAALLMAPTALAEATPIAHYHLKSDEGAIRDMAAPEALESHANGGPTLKAHGAPKVMSNAPAVRSSAYTGSIIFQNAGQCYAAPRNLVPGDNWVVEAWAYATQDNDKGIHTVLANGDGANGFLIIQSGDQWQLFIGGSGGTSLGKVKANTWTHLAIVRDRGTTSAWIGGEKVANQLPASGGGANNFSLGASAPGKEAFSGWISEARVSTFQPGRFEGPIDFLVDTAKAKVVRDTELAMTAKLITALATAPGVEKVDALNERAYAKDWLVSATKTPASVQVLPAKDNQTAQIMLTNGLVSRTFLVSDGNLGCISLRRADKDIEFVRAVKPEARVCLNGQWVDIGGLTGALDHGFITPDWYHRLHSSGQSFHLTGMKIGPCVKPYEWQPKCNAPKDIPWPALGNRVTFEFAPPEGNAALKGLRIDLHYEIYDGIPVMMKTFTLHNQSDKEVVVTKFEGEHLAVLPTNAKMMHVESDYSFALVNFRETSSGLGIHASGARAQFKEYYLGGGTTRFKRDPNWGSMATLNPAEDIFSEDIQNALLISTPPTGPNWTVKPDEIFDAFRTFTILNDTTEDERRSLAQRRFYKTLAPQSNEHLLEVHYPYPLEIKHLGPLLDRMHEVGFEQLQAPEHPHKFNYADTSPGNIAAMKVICDYAKKYNIRVGAYQLMMGSQGWGTREDNYNCIDPATKSPSGGAFGTSACGASAWADMYYNNMWKVIEETGMGAFKPDGPFHGDSCAATDHPHHKGLEDSQWAQWMWMCKVLREGQRRNLYLTIPDHYVLNGQTCTGMGYREATDNIDIGLQTLLYRQYIFDGTWYKTAGMGWVNLNSEMLHGGPEKDLDRYERMFFTLLSSGAQVWLRGYVLHDGPQSKAMLIKWITWYKKYRDLVQGDIIHLRRPDGRGLDYTLHVDPKNKRGMLLVFNPLKQPVTKTLSVPLYYTGLSGQARIREQEGEAKTHALDGQSQVNIEVAIPADGFSWYIIE